MGARGSVTPGHQAIPRARSAVAYPRGSHFGCPHRGEFRHAAAGHSVAGRVPAWMGEPLPMRGETHATTGAQGEPQGQSGGCRRGSCQTAGGQGSPRCRDPGRNPQHGAGAPDLPPGRGGGLRAAGPRARAPALAPPPGSPRARHPVPSGPRPATHRSPPPAPPAAPAPRRPRRHRKRFSRQSRPARRRRPVRAFGARPRAELGGRVEPRTRPGAAALFAQPRAAPRALPRARAFADGSSPPSVSAVRSQVRARRRAGLSPPRPVPLLSIWVSPRGLPFTGSFVYCQGLAKSPQPLTDSLICSFKPVFPKVRSSAPVVPRGNFRRYKGHELTCVFKRVALATVWRIGNRGGDVEAEARREATRLAWTGLIQVKR